VSKHDEIESDAEFIALHGSTIFGDLTEDEILGDLHYDIAEWEWTARKRIAAIARATRGLINLVQELKRHERDRKSGDMLYRTAELNEAIAAFPKLVEMMRGSPFGISQDWYDARDNLRRVAEHFK